MLFLPKKIRFGYLDFHSGCFLLLYGDQFAVVCPLYGDAFERGIQQTGEAVAKGGDDVLPVLCRYFRFAVTL